MGSESRLVYTRTTSESTKTGYTDGLRDSGLAATTALSSPSCRKMRVESTVAGNRADKVDDSICANPTSGRQQQQQQQKTVVRRQSKTESRSENESMIMRQSVGHYEPLQRHHHDNNNNNNNNGKLRLLVAPATTPDEHGSKQQLVHSTTIATPTLPFNWQQHRQQQHHKQQHRSQQVNRPKNYHHYDYYTDSDLTSSILASQANHYEENILLFATEHTNTTNQISNGNERAHQQQQQQVSCSNHANGVSLKRPQSSLGQYAKAAPTGKFVNYYPSWRQSRSLTGGQQNYSFHVPNSRAAGQLQQSQLAIGQSRNGYGFVAAANTDRPNGFRQSYRSRTIAHIPDMVRVSHKSNYEDFYERPNRQTVRDKQFIKSEADLLKVHVLDITSNMVDEGFDNPFKPGTELSWEADMMVRLMKRGYPLEELPALVQTAKQVALELQRNSSARELKPVDQSDERQLQKKAPIWRQSSSDLLSAGKQVWANSLGRAKSMPRFSAAAVSQDADSIDKLISSIEVEMSNLMRQRENPQVVDSAKLCQQRQETTEGESSAISKVKPSNKRVGKKKTNKKESNGDINERQQVATSAIITRRLSDRQGGVLLSEANGNGQPDLISDEKRKLNSRKKKKERNCCIIQ